MWSFYLGLVLCIVSVLPAIFDHGERKRAFRAATNRKERLETGLKWILINWGLPLLALAVTVAQGFESNANDKQLRQVGTNMVAVTEELGQTKATNALLRSNISGLEMHVSELTTNLVAVGKTANDTRILLGDSNTTARLNQTQTVLAEANKVASEVRNVVASSNLATLAKISESVAERHLTEAQIESLNKWLKIGPTGPVVMSSIFNDREGEKFREEIRSVLRANGFTSERSQLFSSVEPEVGIRVYTKDNFTPPHLLTVCRAFVKSGLVKAPVAVTASPSTTALSSTNELEICIGSKP